MKNYSSIIKINLLFLLPIAGLILGVYLQKSPLYLLFLPPQTPPTPTAGLFTHTFQILCCIPPLVCAFTFALLKRINPAQESHHFFLVSALVTGGFLCNEIYRFHIILLHFNIPKTSTIAVYAIIVLLYIATFLKRIQTTPYQILLSSLSLLFVAILVDFWHLRDYEIASLLEGIPKLLSAFNLALYFWLICQAELLKTYAKNRIPV